MRQHSAGTWRAAGQQEGAATRQVTVLGCAGGYDDSPGIQRIPFGKLEGLEFEGLSKGRMWGWYLE